MKDFTLNHFWDYELKKKDYINSFPYKIFFTNIILEAKHSGETNILYFIAYRL